MLIASLWSTAVCPLLILFPSHIRSSQQGMLCDTESHCDKEVTPPLLAVSLYISLPVFTPSLQPPPSTQLLPGLLLWCITFSSYTTVTAFSCGLRLPLWQQTAIQRAIDESSSEPICVVRCNGHISSVKTCLPCDILNNMVRRLQKPEEIVLLQNSCFKSERCKQSSMLQC